MFMCIPSSVLDEGSSSPAVWFTRARKQMSTFKATNLQPFSFEHVCIVLRIFLYICHT